MPPTLIETVRVVNGVAPLWRLHLERVSRSCGALGLKAPALVPPERGPDRVCRYEISAAGVLVVERDPGPTTAIKVITSRCQHRPYPHKTTERGCFEQAQAEAVSAGAQDAILLSPDGMVTEGTIWTICWWEMGLLCGPALDLGVLPGVGRRRLLELRRYIVERRRTRRALTGVPVFLVNAARGIVEIDLWDGERVPRHPETARLASQFWP